MIVKKRSMKVSPATLYGVAGGVFGLVTIGLMINSHLAPETYPACAERYASAGVFALKRSSGELLQPADLQSRLAGQEWGVLHNIAIRADDTAPMNAALTVTFNPGGSIDHARRSAASGTGFNWKPGYLSKVRAACLSYSVRLPEDFSFGKGGTLPGLYGIRSDNGETKPDFSVRMRWLEHGRIGVQPVAIVPAPGRAITLNEKRLDMPRGRWVQIEQEVVLNTPGKADGVLRIWIDGKLQLTLSEIAYRKAASAFEGVIADTHYADGAMQWAPAPKATKVELSPLIVRWNAVPRG